MIGRETFVGLLKKAAVMCDRKTDQATLKVRNRVLGIIAADGEAGSARIRIETEYEGRQLDAGYNIGYFLQMLKESESDEITVTFGERFTRLDAEKGYTYLVAPYTTRDVV